PAHRLYNRAHGLATRPRFSAIRCSNWTAGPAPRLAIKSKFHGQGFEPLAPAIILHSLAGGAARRPRCAGGGRVNASVPSGRNAGECLLNGRVSKSPAINGKAHDELPGGNLLAQRQSDLIVSYASCTKPGKLRPALQKTRTRPAHRCAVCWRHWPRLYPK